jgi:hypothetical protein
MRELSLLCPRRGPPMTMRATTALVRAEAGSAPGAPLARAAADMLCAQQSARRLLRRLLRGFCGSGAPSCIPQPFQNGRRGHNAARSRARMARRP